MSENVVGIQPPCEQMPDHVIIFLSRNLEEGDPLEEYLFHFSRTNPVLAIINNTTIVFHCKSDAKTCYENIRNFCAEHYEKVREIDAEHGGIDPKFVLKKQNIVNRLQKLFGFKPPEEGPENYPRYD